MSEVQRIEPLLYERTGEVKRLRYLLPNIYPHKPTIQALTTT
jgi:hypothetical protein